MKLNSNSNFKLLKFLFIICLISSSMNEYSCLKSESLSLIESNNKAFLKEKSNTGADDKDKTPDKVPIINVHMEEADRDPIEVKRIEEERRIERNRIREMETLEEMDKRTFQKIIAMQNSQLAKLTTIADKSSQILTRLTNKGQSSPSMSFKQRERNNRHNGPLNYDNFLQ